MRINPLRKHQYLRVRHSAAGDGALIAEPDVEAKRTRSGSRRNEGSQKPKSMHDSICKGTFWNRSAGRLDANVFADGED